MSSQSDRLNENLSSLRSQLTQHPVYREIQTIEDLRVFMEHHVYAVWDFMSLLKALQREFTCTSVPWIPPENPLAARLVNEIVLAEESDQHDQGGYGSHFDLYLEAMHDVGASTVAVDAFVSELRSCENLDAAMSNADVPMPARRFMRRTFEQIASQDQIELSASMLYGREDLIPSMFIQMVAGMSGNIRTSTDSFLYYLNRHIELDGDEHGPLATRLIESLCGTDVSHWELAEEAAARSLDARLDFWNDLESVLPSKYTSTTWDLA